MIKSIVGEPVKIYRTFWCNPISGGCGHSFEIDQDNFLFKSNITYK